MQKTDLICLPFAGGDEYAFVKLFPFLKDDFNIICPHIAGKGSRFKEPAKLTIESLVDDIYEQLQTKRKSEQLIVYGHSMGGLLTFLLLQKLELQGDSADIKGVISGIPAPCKLEQNSIHELPDGAFIEEVTKTGGIPKELLAQEKLLQFYTPMLKSDYQVFNSFDKEHVEGLKIQSQCDIIVGSREVFTWDDVILWKNYFQTPPDFHLIEGDHFFIFPKAEKVSGIIKGLATQKAIK